MKAEQPTCHHYCNEPLRCPSCIKRFWQWAQSHTNGSPRSRRGPKLSLTFYEYAAKK